MASLCEIFPLWIIPHKYDNSFSFSVPIPSFTSSIGSVVSFYMLYFFYSRTNNKCFSITKHYKRIPHYHQYTDISLLRNIIYEENKMQKIRPDLDIGRNIQQVRYLNGFTQDQVIARLNLMGIPISKSTYAKLETNRMNIKVSELLALAQIFHCDVGEFFKNLL